MSVRMDIRRRLKIDSEADTPLVAQLTEQLTWLIASGVLEEGDHLPPMRTLAGDLGIHMHTVRQAYHHLEANQLVSVRTRTGTVVQPFDPAVIAGSQPDQRSFLIGVLIPAPVQVYQPFLQAIHETVGRSGWLPLIAYTQDNPFLSERYLHQLIAKRVDGFIVTSPGEVERLERLIDSEHLPPIVYADAPHIPKNSVNPDTEGAAYAVTRHLLEHGLTKIGLITAPLDWENVTPCQSGYRRALQEAGFEMDPGLIAEVPDFEPGSGYHGALELISSDQKLDAIFVIADALALGALQALREVGLKVPNDIALASYGDIDAASHVSPPLTTAAIPAYEMGQQTVVRLQALVAGHELPDDPIVLNCPLVIRQSCGCTTSVNHLTWRGQ